MLVQPLYNLVVGSLSLLAAIYVEKYKEIDKTKFFSEISSTYALPQIKEYDFIIVGGGTAGGIVANRLSEQFSVLIIEAGGDPIPLTYVPSNSVFNIENPHMMDMWETQPQFHSALDDDGILKLGQGRFLGGTSVINGLNYNRGHPSDYDHWANLTGDSSWSYENMLKYFQMTEDFYEDDNSDGHLGVGGPMTIRKGGREFKETYQAFIDSGKKLGYKKYLNSNGPQIEGVGPISTTTTELGRRVSVYDAFIKPILNREKLTISRYSTASKINIDGNKRAVGVFYTRHGIQSYATAKYEVILSAGAMNSPMILLRSGIGPKEQLDTLNIQVVSNLPVGKNFQDHPLGFVCSKYNDPTKYPVTNDTHEYIQQFINKGTGPLTLSSGCFAQAFLVSSQAKLNNEFNWPDIEFGVQMRSKLHAPNGDNSLCFHAILGRSKSQGSITLDPKNVMGQGIFNPNWLTQSEDVKVFGEALKIASQFLDSKSFKEYGITLNKTPHPSCQQFEFGSTKYWECYGQRTMRSCWHAVGTCKMGATDDPTAVVDSNLKVKGVEGLRVVDNSIQPVIINANVIAAAMAIAQKASEIIIKLYEPEKLKTEL